MGWISRPRARWRAATGLVAAALLGALSVTALGTTPAAASGVQEGIGREIKPGQPMSPHAPSRNWLGSYLVGGKQVFCVSFQKTAPNSDEVYKPGQELLTKWGDKIPTDQAANISYLLLRYGNTQDPDEAAALAHLLHSWTSAPRPGHDDLNPNLTADEIGYDAQFHLDRLPQQAKDDVAKLTADAVANRGPWTASVTAPKDPQHLGQPATWTFQVKNAKGKGVADIPVKLTATAATILPADKSGKTGQPDASATGNSAPQAAPSETTLKTGADGTVTVKLSPTGDQPKLAGSLSAPADRPYVQEPVRTGIQNVVSTGGEKTLTAQGVVAVAKPGKVQVTKTDAKTGKGIGGATLRITGKDRKSAATSQDGKPLVGPDGQPAVVTTSGDNGTAAVENLLAPQDICVVEVNAPPGYTNAFDPNNPPAACGSLQPGGTLALTAANTPNEVPHAIPAGDRPVTVARGTVETSFSTPGLAGLAALVLIGSGLVGFAARRSARR
ncbi:MSCRAMM family protein [Amycolatopsis benzoatilytica]|uniref:MSCRAMM family protein n=1 Tax=Amycolatopsis benzoatilytica TaxID=346045 RepID=UPI0003635EAA|nr:SpaA isopeptide-forming pilin-related protein [Amycolatopsis benzoatilytica]